MDQSTAHVLRGGVESRRFGNWLEFAVAVAPEGFDQRRDGVCIHRAGTVLYLSPLMSGLLGFGDAESMIGGEVVDLFQASKQAEVAFALEQSGRDATAPALLLTLMSPRGGRVEITARRAIDAMPPVDVLYVRAVAATDAVFVENEPAMVSPEGEPRTTPRTRRPTILICDDEARLGALTAGLLTEYGFAPITVGTGEDALRTLAAGDPDVDVVLLDVNLSAGRSARDVLVEMRSSGVRARVILTSGLAEEDVDADLVNHPSVVGYIAKPYGVEQLVQSINRALGRAIS